MYPYNGKPRSTAQLVVTALMQMLMTVSIFGISLALGIFISTEFGLVPLLVMAAYCGFFGGIFVTLTQDTLRRIIARWFARREGMQKEFYVDRWP